MPNHARLAEAKKFRRGGVPGRAGGACPREERMGVRLATVLLISAIALAGAPSYAGSEAGVFKGATKARLVTNITPLRGREDAASFCRISRGEIERAVRSILEKAGIALTEKGADITVIIDIDLYYEALDEPVDVCAGRVAVRVGISAEVYLPHSKATARTWVDLFDRADTLIAAKGNFAPDFTAMVAGLVKKFAEAWASDQER